MNKLTDWNQGKSVIPTGPHLQEPVDAIRDLMRRVSKLEVPADSLKFQERFPAIVTKDSSRSPGDPDYTDARYSLKRQRVNAAGVTDAVTLADNNEDVTCGLADCLMVTGTNLAEIKAKTHSLPTDGSLAVEVFAFYDGGDPQNKHYFFLANTPGGQVLCQITANDGAGQYIGTIYDGASTATVGGSSSMPQGLTAGGSALIINADESGLVGNRLKINSWILGTPHGTVSTYTIVIMHGGVGRTDSPTVLPRGENTPDTGTWNRETNGTPVSCEETDTYWDSTDGILKKNKRTLTFDARGMLFSISAESEVDIDTTVPCT